jgi:glutamine---fructose-6-phosphate transaminase (isomerizing)
MPSAMRETIWGQPAVAVKLLADREAAAPHAERLRGRRILLAGTGTSWHAAAVGAAWMRMAGQDAWAVQASEAEAYGPWPSDGDALVLLSHRGTKRYTNQLLDRARQAGAEVVTISGRHNAQADLTTSDEERSAAFTASHLGAMLRLAQLATELGADLGDLNGVPSAIEDVLFGPWQPVAPPARLLQFTGAGVNAWTAAEAALKIRETAYVAADGMAVEQLLHGPSVALRQGDSLVLFDGGGPLVQRLEELAGLARAYGADVRTIAHRGAGEPLSVFPLTVAGQRIALEAAEALGTNPDSFGRDLPGRAEALSQIQL